MVWFWFVCLCGSRLPGSGAEDGIQAVGGGIVFTMGDNPPAFKSMCAIRRKIVKEV
jgi:hypothetical protein